MAETLRAMARFRVSLTAATASRMRKGTAWSCAVLIKARTSLGKQEPPKPGPGMQKLTADPVVESDAASDLLHIGADLLTKIRDLINECYFGRQERIGGIFDKLSSPPSGV